jgi:hypothetical protein
MNMNARKLYGESTIGAWTRVDMLIQLYAAAVAAASDGARQIASSQRVETSTRMLMQRILGQLSDGLDLSQGDVPAQVQRLLLFSLNCVSSDDAAQWESMTRVLSSLHEAFQGIRREAVEAERQGEIPPLAGHARRDTLSLHG